MKEITVTFDEEKFKEGLLLAGYSPRSVLEICDYCGRRCGGYCKENKEAMKK